MNMDAKRVLEIGGGPAPKAKLIPGWADAVIETLDADEKYHPMYLCDAAHPTPNLAGRFDGLFASHVLEHFPYRMTAEVLTEWAKLLKDGGEMHIVVPSLEWACREVLAENPNPGVIPHMFGGQTTQWDGHYVMFTMRGLRASMQRAGLNVVAARTGPYMIRVGMNPDGSDRVVEAEQHYVKAVKGDVQLRKE